MLKTTQVELEKSSNADMYPFIDKGMRWSNSQVAKRYTKAYNKYCPDYDKEKSEKYIIYLHMNHLYGCAMSEYLPYGGFKWVTTNNKTVNRILN